MEAMREIVWRLAWNKWFEYPAGSRLLYFRFPGRYRLQALGGVRVWYNKAGPSSKRHQPPMGPKEREVLQRKITKQINKGYIVGPQNGQHKSVIKYFAVPKGVVEGVAQDW